MADSERNGTASFNVGHRGNLSRQVRQALERYIKENDLDPGDKLPTEPELCALFGVSRTALREAMKALETLGVVSIEPGRGTFLRTFDIGVMLSNLPTSLAFKDKDFQEIVEARRYLERFCVERAVEVVRSNPEHPLLDELEKCMRNMKARVDAGEDMWEEDIRFHRTLALLADNRVLLMILEIFWKLRGSLPMDTSPDALQTRYHRHLKLYEALMKKDAKAAVTQNERHFSASWKEIQG